MIILSLTAAHLAHFILGLVKKYFFTALMIYSLNIAHTICLFQLIYLIVRSKGVIVPVHLHENSGVMLDELYLILVSSDDPKAPDIMKN